MLIGSFSAIIRNAQLDFTVLRKVNYQNLVRQVTIATAQDKQNASSAQKASSVRTLLRNQLLVLRGSTVRQATRHVQFALRGTSVQMVHRLQCVQLDSLHPFDPQAVKHVLQAINALGQECLHQRAARKDSTPTRPCSWDVILVKQDGSVQMVIDQCRVRPATLVNMVSPTARHASQDTTALLAHQIVCHVQQENSVLGLLFSQ